MSSSDRPHWPPLESNPEVFTKLSHALGLSPTYGFVDIFGLDDDCLGFVPAGTIAVILLHPGGGRAEAAGERAGSKLVNVPEGLRFLEQIDELHTACGTVALLHALMNNASLLKEGSAAGAYGAACAGLDPTACGRRLLEDAEINRRHCEFAGQGQTRPLGDEEEVGSHFVCFTQGPGGHLFELDGVRRGGVVLPRDHGALGADSLLHKVAQIVSRDYVEKGGQVNISLMALTVQQSEE